jgi:acyl-CoA reductase-like NAD-dependent aldehyde dehydrogenase
MEHALRNASRKDVERIAHAVVDGAKEWLDKPAYEKGESLGRATTAIASEVAIDVLTEGIGTVATLRKVGKVAEAADHVRDAEKVVERAARGGEVLLPTREGFICRRGAVRMV